MDHYATQMNQSSIPGPSQDDEPQPQLQHAELVPFDMYADPSQYAPLGPAPTAYGMETTVFDAGVAPYRLPPLMPDMMGSAAVPSFEAHFPQSQMVPEQLYDPSIPPPFEPYFPQPQMAPGALYDPSIPLPFEPYFSQPQMALGALYDLSIPLRFETYFPHPCLVATGRTGNIIKSCVKCHGMKVRCERPESVTPNPTPKPQQLPSKHAKSKVPSRKTRATSHARVATPILESEEYAIDESVAGDKAGDINADAAADVAADVNIKMSVDPPVASANDFPPDHWIEPTSDNMPLRIPTPTPVASPLSLSSASVPLTIISVHERVLALSAQVNAMNLGDQIFAARLEAMEKEFEMRISSMRAELSEVQQQVVLNVSSTDGPINMVEKLRQAHVATNPSFPAPPISNLGGTVATTQVQALGMQFLNGVYGPSVAPSASRPSGWPDPQGQTFTSGHAASISAVAGPSSAPVADQPHFDLSPPSSAPPASAAPTV
ncbi:hypothetical protein DEU56DRAFT_946307 [Suillus clintonianus]|uniref:uncharacterized protein n=1 Tax=Suillus clintonianus TaxID=1904413 RepID=UPI001B874F4C|nr:uncharacterized protein DEU56DRAFT_946307 [Suillus clintonianus]KAG2137012.1 hypothetical protein DEU56DRAFT_946307 [Suillus clintonianus]